MDILAELKKIGTETKDALERFMGDEETYLKYVRGFPEEPTMNALTQAMDGKDYAAAERAVHTLKGIAGNLGFVPLADASVDMLEELRHGSVKDALDAYEDVKKQYAVYGKVIGAWKNE